MVRTVLLLASLAAGPASAGSPSGWHAEAERLCLLPPYDAGSPVQAELRALLARLDGWGDPPGALTASFRASGAALCLDDRPSQSRGVFEVEHNLIALADRLTADERLVILVHELRHLDQYARGFCPSTDYRLDARSAVTYAVEADAQAITTYVAWTFAEAGTPGPWRALLGMEHYADIANAFAEQAASGAATAEAVARAFSAWYDDAWRVETYHQASCIAYYDEIDRSKRLPSYDALPQGYFDGLCILPDGNPYGCEPQEAP